MENEYLEVWLDEGIIGLGIFLWLIVTIFWSGLMNLNALTAAPPGESGAMRPYYLLGALSGFLAMLAHNFMDVSMRFVSSGIFLWLLAGLAAALMSPRLEDETPEEDLAVVDDRKSLFLRWACQALGAVALTVFAVWMARQFHQIQMTFPFTYGEKLLWVISWGAFVFVTAATLIVFTALLGTRRSWVALAFSLAMLYPLRVTWGYFVADAEHNLGIAYSKQTHWAEAEKRYENVIRLNPNYLMAYYFLGNVYADRWQSGDGEKTFQTYGRLWRLAPNYVQTHYQAGVIEVKYAVDLMSRMDQAVGAGHRTESRRFAGEAESHLNRSLQFFHKYQMIDPVFKENYVRMSWVYTQKARLDQTLGKPGAARADMERAEGCLRYSLDAVDCLKPVHSILPKWHRIYTHEDYDTLVNLGNLLFSRSDYPGALEPFQRAVSLSPDNPIALRNTALTLMRLGRNQASMEYWTRLKAVAPNDPDVKSIFKGR